MGAGTVLTSFVLFIYIFSIIKNKPFSGKKQKLLYGFVLVTLGLSLMVPLHFDLGMMIYMMNETIGSLVKMWVKS
jgi:hypothetical protein